MSLSTRARVLLLAGSCLGAASIGGLIWHSVTVVQTYTVGADHGAVITERGLSQLFAMDVWYVFTGLIVGILLGSLTWTLFHQIGWWVAPLAALVGLIAAVICWQLGEALGPSDFAARVAAALPGDKVPVDFTLHTLTALLTWPFGALIPVILYAAFERNPVES
ncbi:MAG: hypothetical protein LBC29_02695 [Propionibacteriaceae bacterium]|jgi:hypothetical protein|nr:hypothetical protein [Propionibacteriaceae bacterium]